MGQWSHLSLANGCDMRTPKMKQVLVSEELLRQVLNAACSPYCAQDLGQLMPAIRAALEQPAPVQEPVCRGCGIPANDLHMSTCPTKKWPMRVTPADAAQPAPVQEPQCNPHPKAPHGFDRNASHSSHRYVCDCESWEPYDAGYNEGFHAGLKAEQADGGLTS